MTGEFASRLTSIVEGFVSRFKNGGEKLVDNTARDAWQKVRKWLFDLAITSPEKAVAKVCPHQCGWKTVMQVDDRGIEYAKQWVASDLTAHLFGNFVNGCPEVKGPEIANARSKMNHYPEAPPSH